MTRLFGNKKVCATMFVLFALAVLVNSFAGGSLPSFGSNSVLAPEVQSVLMAADDSPFFPPDPYESERPPMNLS